MVVNLGIGTFHEKRQLYMELEESSEVWKSQVGTFAETKICARIFPMPRWDKDYFLYTGWKTRCTYTSHWLNHGSKKEYSDRQSNITWSFSWKSVERISKKIRGKNLKFRSKFSFFLTSQISEKVFIFWQTPKQFNLFMIIRSSGRTPNWLMEI